MKWGFLSTYPPTQCGLATFTKALVTALDGFPGNESLIVSSTPARSQEHPHLGIARARQGHRVGHRGSRQTACPRPGTPSPGRVTGRTWTFGGRGPAPVTGTLTAAALERELFVHLAGADHEPDALTAAVVAALPYRVGSQEIEEVLADLHPDLLLGPNVDDGVIRLRRWSRSGYTVSFGEDTQLEQRLLLPAADDESHGIEDARFTLFEDEDGEVTYRACYTAYDGHNVRNRVLISPDLRTFRSYPLSGPGSRNKGMALFPHRVNGRYLALTRADGLTIGVTESLDGFFWEEPSTIEAPKDPWQLLKVGNGSPPLETSEGWLVITHGVGFMRTYSLGALLLDLDEPSRVLARLDEPLLQPMIHAGYVPNVVFTCGAVIHQGRLFVPHGVGDNRVRVGSIPVSEVLRAMVRTDSSRTDSTETNEVVLIVL